MKTFKITLMAIAVAMATSCSDSDDENTAALSNDEAAEIIGSSLAESSSGLTTVVDQSITATETGLEASEGGRIAACGYSDSESFNVSNPQGAAITYNYSYEYQYLLSCGLGDMPQSMAIDGTYNGSFNGPRLESAHGGTVDLDVTELDEVSGTYSIDGHFTSTGSFQSKIGNQTATSSDVDITVNSIEVDKTSKSITGGSASVGLAGTATGRGSFSLSATIVFNGDGTATVTINGSVYTVDLVTGEIDG